MQIVISFNKPDRALELYKERWQIKTAFRALKTSGLHIEDTHLTEIERIEKLFALVIVAYILTPIYQAWGEYEIRQKIVPITYLSDSTTYFTRTKSKISNPTVQVPAQFYRVFLY